MTNNNISTMYLQKQESFLVDVIRRCLEAETRLAQTREELSEVSQKLTIANEQISHLLSGLDSTSKERDQLREEHARYRDELIELGDLKEKCEKIKANYQDHMTNYELVKQAYDKLAADYELLKSEHDKLLVTSIEKKSPSKTTKKDDWS